MTEPTHPVIVGAHELSVRTADGEPIAMMVAAAQAALAVSDDRLLPAIESIRVVKGIWPYADPGQLVAHELGIPDVHTAITRIGGNATYDLVNETAASIASGDLTAAIVCGAESMRTRRKDKREGRRSPYREEADGAAPDLISGADQPLVDDADAAAGVDHPVNFYAMADSVIRHERGETPAEHLARISELWAHGSAVASTNPNAWLPDRYSATEIATPSPTNRMVAAPYTKLLTSNINVDQGAAVVMCSYATAQDHGIPDAEMVFLVSGGGAYDPLTIRERTDLHRSPAFDAAAQSTLARAQVTIDEVEQLDLYSCFPASVQLAQESLGLDPDRTFTITGGLTFAGGPFNGYCTQALARATGLLRGTADTAFLYGNGGFFSKHSTLIVSGAAPTIPYSYARSQDDVDALPTRALGAPVPESGTLEAYTVTYDRSGDPARAICAVLDDSGQRHWAVSLDDSTITSLLLEDRVGSVVTLTVAEGGDADSREEPLRAHLP